MCTFPARLPIDDSFLTACEAEVLWFCLQGMTTNQIADELSRSSKTICRHRENIRLKFGLTGYHTLEQFAMKVRPELAQWVK